MSAAQVSTVDSLNQKHLNWYNLDHSVDKVMGTSIDKAWLELPNNRQPGKTIIVAVIDSGIDIDHEDLKESIWVNEGEIPNNNIDDDHNGYIDDVHGWNFIGNSSGENINFENMEYTRIYKAGESHPGYERAKKSYIAEPEKRERRKQTLRILKTKLKRCQKAAACSTRTKHVRGRVNSMATSERWRKSMFAGQTFYFALNHLQIRT